MSVEEHLGKELRARRLQKRWSQEKLALDAGVDRNYVSLVELGRNSPSVKILFKLCDALGVSPAAVLKAVEAEL